jgi:hypothetical protein
MAASAMVARQAAMMPTQERLLDYHLYTLPRTSSLLDHQIKQVALLSADRIPVVREYVLENADPGSYQRAHPEASHGLKPAVWLRFDNRAPGLGLPLPAGIVRVYLRDSQGTSQLVGEDTLPHTAAGETARLRLGDAFDLSADRTQTEFKILGPGEAQASFRLELRNADLHAATVEVREAMPGGDWRITAETLVHQKPDSATASWKVVVPGEGHAALGYTVRVRW